MNLLREIVLSLHYLFVVALTIMSYMDQSCQQFLATVKSSLCLPECHNINNMTMMNSKYAKYTKIEMTSERITTLFFKITDNFISYGANWRSLTFINC